MRNGSAGARRSCVDAAIGPTLQQFVRATDQGFGCLATRRKTGTCRVASFQFAMTMRPHDFLPKILDTDVKVAATRRAFPKKIHTTGHGGTSCNQVGIRFTSLSYENTRRRSTTPLRPVAKRVTLREMDKMG